MLNRRDLIALAATSFGAAVTSSAEMHAAAEPTMSLNVVYLNSDGARFDTSYYRSTHIPLAMKVMAATSVMLIEGRADRDDRAFPVRLVRGLAEGARQPGDGRRPCRRPQVHRHQAHGDDRQGDVAPAGVSGIGRASAI